MKQITDSTTIHELLEEYPFLEAFLIEYNPRFAMLKNPVMRATVARAATLKNAAEKGGVDLDELRKALEDRIREEAESQDQPKGAEAAGTADHSKKVAELASLIRDLHDGVPPDEAKARFDSVVRDVSPAEIGQMEEQLIREGLPVQEIQRLCDLHVSVVKTGLDNQEEVSADPGHPIHTYMAANEVITTTANALGALCAQAGASDSATDSWRTDLGGLLDQLAGLDNHYVRKENEVFPVLERYGVTGPSQVMWGVHDEIRGQWKEAKALLEAGSVDDISAAGAALARSAVEMVYKENKILLPLCQQTFSQEDWRAIRDGEDELGYAFFKPTAPFPSDASKEGPTPRPMPDQLHPDTGAGGIMGLPIVSAEPTAPIPEASDQAYVDLGTGRLSIEQVDMMLRHLPIEISFVDADGFVRYYSDTEERLFPRTPGAIGRHVENCHPPKSVHMVKEILEKFAAGERDVADFWIEMGERFIHIRYFAVRNPEKAYLGCLEVTQDVTEIRALEGQRRLLEWS